jgi:trans-2,3-dihydro-3-hydroxyanthranilate isomerase
MKYLTLDVFTSTTFGGNPLAVILDARGLDTAQMQAITREFNYSESAFILPPDDPAHTARVRIFTPAEEVPFAGHPTVGTALALLHTGAVTLDDGRATIVLEEGVGPVPVTIEQRDGAPPFAQFTTAKLPEVRPPGIDRDTLAYVLSLEPEELLGGDHAPEAVSCGLPFLIVPLRDRTAVANARLRLEPWEESLRHAWANMVMVFAADAEFAGHDLRARMFAPGLMVSEDPATGSACAALAGYLAVRTPRDGTVHWVVEQGFEMGRPSILYIEADKEGGEVVAVRVGGEAVVVCEGEISVG